MRVKVYNTEAEWLDARYDGIGASESAIPCHASRWGGEFSLFESKVNRTSSFKPNEMSEAGHRLEPVVADWFAEQKVAGPVIDPGPYTIVTSSDHPFIFCTPDRTIGSLFSNVDSYDKNPPLNPGVPPLEIKCVFGFAKNQFKTELPPCYQIQLQTQMLCLEADYGYFAVFIAMDAKFKWFKMDRHQKFIDRMVEQCSRFWDCVQSGTPPATDATAETRMALSRFYDTPKPTTVDLDYTYWDDHQAIVIAKAAIKAAEKTKLQAENRIKAGIGNAQIGRLHNGDDAYHWRPPNKKGTRTLSLTKVKDQEP